MAPPRSWLRASSAFALGSELKVLVCLVIRMNSGNSSAGGHTASHVGDRARNRRSATNCKRMKMCHDLEAFSAATLQEIAHQLI
jgi:hypothetical protein